MSKPTPAPLHHLTFGDLEQLMAQLLDGVILMDTAGTILSVNAAALRMHGVRKVDELGATAEEYARRFTLLSADHRKLKRRDYPLFRLLAGESFPDLVVEVAPAGNDETRWVHQVRDVTMDDDGGEPDYLALVINDVTERFDAEVRFNAMFHANPAPAIIVRQRDGRVIRTNPGFLALTGYRCDQVDDHTLAGLDLLGGLIDPALFSRQIDKGEIIPQQEAELLVADGSRRLVLLAGQPIDVTDDDAVLITFADLEPRRQAQQALAASEQHLAAVFEMAPVPMLVTRDADGGIASANAALRRLTGYDEDELVGRTVDQVRLWADAKERHATDVQVQESGSQRDGDARLLAKDGKAIDCLVSAETISVEGAPCVLWVYEDVSESRRTEQELVDAIDAVMKDANWLSRSIMDKLATLRRPGPAAPSVDLSPREREILEMICDDIGDAAIAERLKLSRNTVRNHVARLYAKIGVNRRSGAVIWGRERGLGSLRT